MKYRLFPGEFLLRDGCFGLFRPETTDPLDLPVTIDVEDACPVHVVHSDPEQLAYLTALVVLQAWASGINELGVPPSTRRPIVVVTERPGRFAEAYLRLHLPTDRIEEVFRRRRVTLYEKTGSVPEASAERSSYLEIQLGNDDPRTRIHNFFPAAQIAGAEAQPRTIASREFVGRGDRDDPAVLITRRSDTKSLAALRKRFDPLLMIFDGVLHDTAAPASVPSLVYHESIFAPGLDRKDGKATIPICLPDNRFEQFCAMAELRWVEPGEDVELNKVWDEVDSAFQALIERLDQRRDRVLVDVYRAVSRLRTLLLGLPVDIVSYEQGLVASGVHPSLHYDWSVSERIAALASRAPEMAALGEWEELIMQELVSGFYRLEMLLRDHSPKKEVLFAAIRQSRAESRRIALIVGSPVLGAAIKWVLHLPEPRGLADLAHAVTSVTPTEIRTLHPDQDCIVQEVFEPHVIFAPLARLGPRRITFGLLRNELRFVGEHFLRSRILFPEHVANRTILAPVFHHLERLPAAPGLQRKSTATLLGDSEFELLRRMFSHSGRLVDLGTVLFDEPETATTDTLTDIPAYLIRLQSECAVLLGAGTRVSYVDGEGVDRVGQWDDLQPGDRLVIVNPEARESIAERILAARRGEELDHSTPQLIARWHQELTGAVQHLGLTYAEVLAKIRVLGSERISPYVIGQWMHGDVLGPLDAHDLRRLGEALGSQWLKENWQQVAIALVVVRSGHRLLGRQITKLIQRAAIGDYSLTPRDEDFLKQVGITMAELQDSVSLLTVESVHTQQISAPAHQIGKIIPV